jgi:photosystem II stability/assembly factor-like uncharacterized protein
VANRTQLITVSRALAAAIVALMLAACGSAGLRERPAVADTPRSAPAEQIPGCVQITQSEKSGVVPGGLMGAVWFTSDSSGVGLTTQTFTCETRAQDPGSAWQAAEPVYFATTRDGGRSWKLSGTPLRNATREGRVGDEQLVAVSSTDLWARLRNGQLLRSSDGGAHWSRQDLPAPVAQIVRANGVLWALGCPSAPTRSWPMGCRPQLWRTGQEDSDWSRVELPGSRVPDVNEAQLAVTGGSLMIVPVTKSRGQKLELLGSDDSGRSWEQRAAPSWPHSSCNIEQAAASSGRLWLFCVGGAAAGQSANAIFVSRDGGRLWKTVSSRRSSLPSSKPGALPNGEPRAFVAGPGNRLWVSFAEDGLAYSNDLGRFWVDTRAGNSDADPSSLDVLNGTHAWLVTPGVGLWRTTDATHWRALGTDFAAN